MMTERYELLFWHFGEPYTLVPLGSLRLADRLRRELWRQGYHVQINDKVKRVGLA